jgi:beta-lactamase class A
MPEPRHSTTVGDDSPVVPFATPPLPPPVVVAPAPYEASFGRVAGFAGRGTRRIRVVVGGRVLAERDLVRRRFAINVELPRRDVTVRVTAFDNLGRSASRVVGPVFGLPRRAAALGAARRIDPALSRAVRGLARGFGGTCAIYVQDLRTGRSASWNERMAFPAASTLKVAIAVEVLRSVGGTPAAGTRLDVLLRRMLIYSDSKAANLLLVTIGGSTSGGSARVNAAMRAIGLANTDMYGGYEIETDQVRPAFVGKRTTAWDLARLHRLLHLAAGARGALVQRFRGQFTPGDARYLLYVLAHVREPGRLTRFLSGASVLHKAGWIREARHDSGLLYSPVGAFVVSVMTWNPRGVGTAADVLAGKVALVSLRRFAARR